MAIGANRPSEHGPRTGRPKDLWDGLGTGWPACLEPRRRTDSEITPWVNSGATFERADFAVGSDRFGATDRDSENRNAQRLHILRGETA